MCARFTSENSSCGEAGFAGGTDTGAVAGVGVGLVGFLAVVGAAEAVIADHVDGVVTLEISPLLGLVESSTIDTDGMRGSGGIVDAMGSFLMMDGA